MLVKLVTISQDKTLLKNKMAQLFAPFSESLPIVRGDKKLNVAPNNVAAYYKMDGTLEEVEYWRVSKTPTHVNGNRSISVLKIDDSQIPELVEPLILAGALEVIGRDDLDNDEKPSDFFTEDDWNIVRQINPKWGTSEVFDTLLGQVTINHEFIDIQ